MVKRAKSLDKLGRISLLFRIIFIIINIEVMYMKKEIEITIDHLTKDGVGVAKVEKKPIYVANCFAHEKVQVSIDHEGKRNIYGHIKKVIEPNLNRVLPKCKVYNQCGGCHLSFMNYPSQLKLKQEIVRKIYKNEGFENIIVHPCVGMDDPYQYRNKVQTPIKMQKNRIVAGFYKENSHDIVPFDVCHVQSDNSNQIIKGVLKAMEENKISPYDEDKKTGIVRHLLIRKADNEIMLVLVTSLCNISRFLSRKKKFYSIDSKIFAFCNYDSSKY